MQRRLLERKHKPQTIFYSAKDALRNTTRAFLQKLAVQRDDLRDVHHRVRRKQTRALAQPYVAGSLGQIQVGCDGCCYYGLYAAAVECIGLDNQDGSPVAGFGAGGNTKMRPPDLTAPYFHFSLSSDRDCNSANPASSVEAWALSP